MKNTYNILINSQSGTALAFGQEKMENWFTDSGMNISDLCFAKPQEMEQKLAAFMQDDDPLLIGGGDGTIASVAAKSLKENKPFGILPMGTMNLLAKDLCIPEKPADAVAAYTHSHDIFEMDAGFANDELFLCNASLGTIPESAKIRENHRHESDSIIAPRLALFVMDHLDEVHHRPYTMHMGKRKVKVKTPMLVIANNCYEDSGYNKDHSFKRESLRDGILGIYSSRPRNFWDKIRFFLRLSQGGWKKDPIVREWKSKTLHIETDNETELVSLDGENHYLQTPLKFKVERSALKVLLPGGTQ